MVEPRQARECRLERDILRPILRGRDVRRYAIEDSTRFLIFPYIIDNSKFVLVSEKELKKHARHL